MVFSELAGQKLASAGRRRRGVRVRMATSYPQSDDREQWLQVNDRPTASGTPRRRHMTHG